MCLWLQLSICLSKSPPLRPIGAPEIFHECRIHCAENTALLCYLGLLVMAAGIPLVAFCIQSDGGPHATGGAEAEDEPRCIRENDPQALRARTPRTDQWTNKHTRKSDQCWLWRLAYLCAPKMLSSMTTYNWLSTLTPAGQWGESRCSLRLSTISILFLLLSGECWGGWD